MTLVQESRGHRRLDDGLVGPDEGLRRRAAELEAIFEALPDGVLVVDEAGQIVEANRAMLGLLELRRKEQILGPLAQVVQARATRPDGSPLRRHDLVGYGIFRGGGVTHGELRLERGRAEPRLLETVARPIRADDRAILGAVIVSRDVTAQRRREREAGFLTAAVDLLAMATDLAAALTGLAERYVAELADWCAVYVYDDAADALRPTVSRHRDPALAAGFAAALARRPLRPGQGFAGAVFQDGGPSILPELDDDLVRRHARNAREAQAIRQLDLASVLAVPLVGADGPVGALVLGTGRLARQLDEQDLRLAEEVARRIVPAVERAGRDAPLEQALARIEVVLDSMVDGLVVFGGDGRAVLANAAVREMLGLDAEPIGWTAEELARRGAPALADPELLEEIVRQVSAGPEVAGRLELRLARPRPRDLERIASPVRGPDGVVLGQVVLYHDLTHVREVERSRDECVVGISRELRMPLTAVSAYATQALRRARQVGGDRSIVHGLEVVLRNARQLAGLVGDLLDAARVEAGDLDLSLDEVDVLALIGQAVDQARAVTTLHRFRQDAPATLPAAQWDPDRVRQALVNVLTNAIKYWPEGGQIGVRVRLHDEGVLISVRDRGLGIPPDSLERVFERFYRVPDDPARKRVLGNGLGLHLARGVVRAHGGAVWAESSGVAGEGTTVYVFLPWRADPEARSQ